MTTWSYYCHVYPIVLHWTCCVMWTCASYICLGWVTIYKKILFTLARQPKENSSVIVLICTKVELIYQIKINLGYLGFNTYRTENSNWTTTHSPMWFVNLSHPFYVKINSHQIDITYGGFPFYSVTSLFFYLSYVNFKIRKKLPSLVSAARGRVQPERNDLRMTMSIPSSFVCCWNDWTNFYLSFLSVSVFVYLIYVCGYIRKTTTKKEIDVIRDL